MTLACIVGLGLAGVGRAQTAPPAPSLGVSTVHRGGVPRLEITVPVPVGQEFTLFRSANLAEWSPLALAAPDRTDGSSVIHGFDLTAGAPVGYFKATYRMRFTNPVPLGSISGPPDATAAGQLPDLGMPLESESEVRTSADALSVSLAHILVNLSDATTVAEFNALLATEDLTIAGTAPGMQLVVLRRQPGIGDGHAEIEALMTRLRESGLFDAVAPNLGFPPNESEDPAPVPNRAARIIAQEPLLDWTWDAPGLGRGSGGNAGFELSRIPQLWNWIDHGHRQAAHRRNRDVAVLEFGFDDHFDIEDSVELDLFRNGIAGDDEFNHGIAVVGVIAARHDAYGIQGVAPLADRVRGIPFRLGPESRSVFAGALLDQLEDLLLSPTAPRVINTSTQINWRRLGSPETAVREDGKLWADWIKELGKMTATSIRNLNRSRGDADHLIVCAAGNADGIDAKFASPMANVACTPALNAMAPNFLVVENVTGEAVTYRTSNYDHSRTGAAVSAGGTGVSILAGARSSYFDLKANGTSYAAPLVTGLASFLWTLEPSLTIHEIKDLLGSAATTHDAVSESGEERAPIVDGFAAALGIDLLRGTNTLHKALVDVDDGTLDGNLRKEVLHFSEDPDRIHTPDGRRGDGTIDMCDFRAFRDAYLQAHKMADLLDGPVRHFKRDLNFDGLVGDRPASPPHPAPHAIQSRAGQELNEEIHARYDFNGNGRLDESGDFFDHLLEHLAPFKADPDTLVERLQPSRGVVRDVDVLLHPDVWNPGEESVHLGPPPDEPAGGWQIYGSILPHNWTGTRFGFFTLTSSLLDYLWSFDLHIDMEAGTRDAADDQFLTYNPGFVTEGLWIESLNRMIKGRMGEWEGVISVPFVDPDDFFHDALEEEFPWVTVHYKKTIGDQTHQYSIRFRPEPGEDIALAVGFDELQLYSNTRGDFHGIAEHDGGWTSQEIIAKTPGSEPYGTIFVPINDADRFEEAARIAAVEAVGDLLQFPTALNGSPALEAIQRAEADPQGAGLFVQIYGLVATYEHVAPR